MERTPSLSRQHAWAALCHPATVATLGLLLLNDHVLRRQYPSELTGKVGDFAWLFFAPIVAAATFTLLWPDRYTRQRALSGPLGFALVAGIFALSKTVPACHAAIVAVASALFGFSVSWLYDPTDVIALVAIVPAWLLWRDANPRAAWSRIAGGLVISTAVLLTVANSGKIPSNAGITHVWTEDGRVCAADEIGQRYHSADGGMSWSALPTPEPTSTKPATPPDATSPIRLAPSGQAEEPPLCNSKGSATGQMVMHDPTNSAVLFRFAPGLGIARSDDAGRTWRREVIVAEMSRAEEFFHNGLSPKPERGQLSFAEMPWDGAVDVRTAHAIFSMGHRGVLVREPTGEWWWVPVGPYQQMPVPGSATLASRAATPPPSEIRTPPPPGPGGLPPAGPTPPPPPQGLDSYFGTYGGQDCSRRTSDATIADEDFWLRPDDAEAHRWLGIDYYCRGNLDRAFAFLEQAVIVDPHFGQAYADRALIYATRGDYEAALADLARAFATDSHNEDWYSARGRIYVLLGNLDQAIANYDEAIELRDTVGSRIGRGAAYFDRGVYASALADFTAASQKAPGEPIPYCNLGLTYLASGHAGRAADAFEKCEFWSGACQDASLRRKAEDALLLVRTESRSGESLLVPDYGYLPYEQLSTRGDKPDGGELCRVDAARALTRLDDAIARTPTNAWAHYLRGRIQEQAGRKPEAEADYRKTLALSEDPELRSKAQAALFALGD